MAELVDLKPAGVEPMGGRPAHKLTGMARSSYGTGHIFNERHTTVWIDFETLLVRKIVEDTPKGLAAGLRNRVTTTFEPQPNPTLEDSRFRFAVPR